MLVGVEVGNTRGNRGMLDAAKAKSRPGESNPEPTLYESVALPIELGRRQAHYISYRGIFKFQLENPSNL